MSMLYYPNFVPDPTWLRQILLVVDDVKRIVPQGVEVNDPPEIVELCEHNLLQSVEPATHRVDSLDRVTRQNLSYLFRNIGDRRRDRKTQETPAILNPNGSWEINGAVYLHDLKLADSLLKDLDRYGLIEKSQSQQAEMFDGWTAIDKEAAEVIMSLHAACIAQKEGCNTITDSKAGFTFSAVDSLGYQPNHRGLRPQGLEEGLLIAAIQAIMIPIEISRYTVDEYLEIRKEYQGIRQALREVIDQQVRISRLDGMPSFADLVAATKSEADKFQRELDKFIDRPNTYNKITFKQDLLPILIQAAFAVAPSEELSVLGEVATLAGPIAYKLLVPPPCIYKANTAREHVFTMLAKLERDISDRAVEFYDPKH